MNYKISEGIKESELEEWLKIAIKKYGYYQGVSVNFTDADIAPIVMCTVIYGEEILLVKRGFGLADAEGYWSTVNGFIDQIKPVLQIAQNELIEELSLEVNESDIIVGKSYTLNNPNEKRKYIVFPCLVKLDHKPNIILDRENTEYKWINRKDLGKYEILEDLPFSIDSALKLI